ncbi:hypothetical protein GCM10025876_13390 [Demequina litorisediminis]|uniref:Phosphate transport system permease protein PstC n=1 Tax=Demequina litorisediminis TaxID=1849022 RepID=A0ABQ6IBM0_9MICO|nr:hypothetical protein GCM10025876_13390 [Demequina litorisediminis]
MSFIKPESGQSLMEIIGFLIFGTLVISIIALLISTPVSIGIALFISHYAPRRLAQGLGYLIDLLAAVPSVVYGLWGVAVLVPFLTPFYQFLADYLGFIPLFAPPESGDIFTGRVAMSAGIVLAIMILPIITAVSREVFLQTPKPARGGRARHGCDPLGDDQDGRLPVRPLRHDRCDDAGPWPCAR